MKIKIYEIDEQSIHLLDIIKMGDKNRKTLGFFPNGAFDDYAKKGQIICALNPQNNCIGYLLYRTNNSNNRVNIIHLCVDNNHRKKGIAKLLIEHLKNTTLKYYGIGLKCRRDFEANNIWHKYDFIPKYDIPGRGKDKKLLTFWWYEHKHPVLFSLENIIQNETKFLTVLDANIFYDLVNRSNLNYTDVKSLEADWLKDEIQLCLTNEIYNEINRKNDPQERRQYQNYADRFIKLKASDLNLEQELLTIFNKNIFKIQDKSDIIHLVHAIANNTHFFVTKDKNILKYRDKVFEKCNIKIVRPSELIINLDQLKREMEYQPSRLSGSLLTSRRFKANELNKTFKQFKYPNEKQHEFFDIIESYLVEPNLYETIIIQDENQNHVGLLSINRKHNNILKISMIRIKKYHLTNTLAKHIVLKIITIAVEEKRILIQVPLEKLKEELKKAFINSYFYKGKKYYSKINLQGILNSSILKKELNIILRKFKNIKEYIKYLLEFLNQLKNKQNIIDHMLVEKALWPLKINDNNLPTYIIPIKPYWAMNLFDEKIAMESLFGADFKLIANRDNIYYRSKKPNILTTPARILWYISSDKSCRIKQQLRAHSYLEEVHIDKPKPLYNKFKHLGVYEWKNIFDIANKNINNKIMAFRFSNTELFNNPVPWKSLKKILQQEHNRTAPIQSPIKISNKCFIRLYKLAINFNKGE